MTSSTYVVKLSALRTMTEEAMILRYMLGSLRCNFPSDGSAPTRLFGYNLSVIFDSKNSEADLFKKPVFISFHLVSETMAASIIQPY